MVPRPATGGGGNIAVNASWMAANFWFNCPAIATPLSAADLRWSNGFKRDEHDAGIRAVGEAVDRQAGERDRMLDAFGLERDVAHAVHHVLGAVERRAIGQLREADQVLLVLARHEPARHRLEQHEGDADQREIEPHHQTLRPITRATPPL